MSNTIKYSESTEQRALNKGNWWIGTGDSNKGPSDVTGYYAGVTPPSSGYTIYTKREDNLPSIFVEQNDQELIFLTNQNSEKNFTTTQECLNYFQSQDDKLCVNREYEKIVTDGLVLNLDAGYIPSYPQSGITWNDISGNGNNGQLSDDILFNNEGSFSLTELSKINISPLIDQLTEFTISVICKLTDNPTEITILTKNSNVYQSEIVSQTQYYFIDILFQKNGTSVTQYLYINGNQISTKTDTEFDFINLSEFNVKIRKSKKILTPNIVSVKFYNKILSEEEIVSNYNSINTRYNI